MTRGGFPSAQKHFAGSQRLATLDDLDAFVRRARAEESFVYCEAPELIRCETSVRVTALAADGLVRPHRSRREGGGWTFFVVRTGKALPGVKGTIDPAIAALADPATDIIFRALKRAANMGQPCPSDSDLARAAGLDMRQKAGWRVRKLIDAGLIGSTQVYEGGVASRVVTIAATRHAGTAADKFTALPRKWGELQRAAASDLKAAGGQG